MNKINNPQARLLKPEYPSWQEYTIVPVGEKGGFNPPHGSKDNYEINLWMTKYTSVCLPDQIDIDSPEPEPDSYIYIKINSGDPKTSISKLKIEINNTHASLEPNKYGRASQIITTIKADDFRDAIDKAYSLIFPFLSHWAFILNVPIVINAIKAKMNSTGSIRFFGLFEGKTKLFPFNINRYSFTRLESIGVLSLYREAINMSLSPFYQVFLLHRVREGIYNKLRKNTKDKPDEIIKDDCIEVGENFKGFTFSIIHSKIEQKFRNDFAHFNLTKSGILRQSPDRFSNFYECITKWLPVSFYITRKMINDELI